jgi:hypothetical protein
MSQRLTTPAILVTDELGKAWWLFQSGQSVPWIGGAEGEDDNPTDDPADKSEDDKDDDDSDDENDDDADDKSDDDKEDPAKLRERMKAADRRASALQKERDDLLAEKKKQDDAKKTDLERAQSRVKELEADLGKKDAELTNLRVQIAFFGVSTEDGMPKWIDPSEAVAALDLSEVETDANGKINKKQLRKAIKQLAETKKHWVKSGDDDSSGQGPSGSKMNGKRKGEKDAPDVDALAKDFPALKNRV